MKTTPFLILLLMTVGVTPAEAYVSPDVYHECLNRELEADLVMAGALEYELEAVEVITRDGASKTAVDYVPVTDGETAVGWAHLTAERDPLGLNLDPSDRWSYLAILYSDAAPELLLAAWRDVVDPAMARARHRCDRTDWFIVASLANSEPYTVRDWLDVTCERAELLALYYADRPGDHRERRIRAILSKLETDGSHEPLLAKIGVARRVGVSERDAAAGASDFEPRDHDTEVRVVVGDRGQAQSFLDLRRGGGGLGTVRGNRAEHDVLFDSVVHQDRDDRTLDAVVVVGDGGGRATRERPGTIEIGQQVIVGARGLLAQHVRHQRVIRGDVDPVDGSRLSGPVGRYAAAGSVADDVSGDAAEHGHQSGQTQVGVAPLFSGRHDCSKISKHVPSSFCGHFHR